VRETLAKRGQTCPLPPRTKYTPRIAVCGNAGGPELATTVFPFILRGVDLLGIDSDWCDLETRRVLWERMARGGDS
jgi:acrylyl-CoA reductase (NADPH)